MLTRRALVAAAAATPLLPRVARAADDMTIDGTWSASGTVYFDTLTINGTLSVLPLGAGASGSGKLEVIANKIIVNQGGQIDADGAGYAGVDGAAGACSQLATACARRGSAPGQPGGGGGFVGPGTNGATVNASGVCTDLGNAALGGALVFNPTTLALDLGSAGGASNLGTGTTGAPGGAGGGYIQLTAVTIQVDGSVHANGVSPDSPHYGGVGPGGGSGGVIEITATTLEGTGTLAVNGGNGAHGVGFPPSGPANYGGSGSGGVILVHLPPNAPNTVTLSVTGGQAGSCAAAPAGTVQFDTLSTSCLDGASCPAGQVCTPADGGAVCLAPPSTSSSSSSTTSSGKADPPVYIDYGGGCSVERVQGVEGGATTRRSPGRAGFAVALAVALGVRLRKRSRNPRRMRGAPRLRP